MSKRIGVIMAAGEGTRMKSSLTKMLHPLAGLPLIEHVVASARAASLDRIVVVIGHQGDAVREQLGDQLTYVRQDDPKGTGDAVRRAVPHFAGGEATVVVLSGDVPLVPSELIDGVAAACEGGAAAALVTGKVPDPHGYGRIVRDEDGRFVRIVEEADASQSERAIDEVNLGLYAFQAGLLKDALAQLTPDNAQDEYYLVDVLPLLLQQGSVETVTAAEPALMGGVNRRSDLAELEAICQGQLRRKLMDAGVTMPRPEQVYLEVDVAVGADTVLEPGTVLRQGTQIGSGCIIGPNTEIMECRIGDGCHITHSVLEESVVGRSVTIGPFSHIRPGCQLDTEVKIGNYAELKNSKLGAGSKVPHHSYVGDSEVGRGVNLGAGVVTVNYDGLRKHKTFIGDGAFIGCNTNLLAPITVEPGAYVAAGSTLNKNVPSEALAIARARQENKEGWVRRKKALHEKVRKAAEGPESDSGQEGQR